MATPRPRFAANLSFLFTELPFLERFGAAAVAGFPACEMMFPYDHPVEDVVEAVRAAGLPVVLMNLPPGDWAAGERGLAALPDRMHDFASALELGLRYATALGCPRLHCLSGLRPEGVAEPDIRRTLVTNLRRAADAAAWQGVEILVEAINPRDMPGYVLTRIDDALALIAEVDRPNVGLQLDLYHAQVVHGDLTTWLERALPVTRHIQIANVPGRHEPDHGEIAYDWLFARLDALGYGGFIGCEYRPRTTTRAGLGWLDRYR